MASRINGVPVSTTQIAPKVAALSGIRAPLTLVDESDSDYSENHITNSYYSGSESSDDFVTGESDEEIVQETSFVKEFAISRPIVKNPTGNIIQESREIVKEVAISRQNSSGNVVQRSSSSSKIEFLGPLLNSGSSSRNSLSRPYVSSSNEYEDDSDEESIKGDDFVSIFTPVLSVTNKDDVVGNPILGVSSVSVLSRPVALISGESDDDVSEGSVVIEDDDGGDDLSGVVRVPSAGLMQRINSAPKVRILDFKEDRENDSDYGSTLEGEDDEETVINDEEMGITNDEELSNVVGNVQGDLLVKTSQNEVLDSDKELSAKSCVSDLETSVYFGQVKADKQELDVTDCKSEFIDSCNSGELDSDKELSAKSCVSDLEYFGQVKADNQELDVTDGKIEFIDSCNSGELADLVEDSLSVALGEPVGLEITDTNGRVEVVFHQDFESCNEEAKTESESVDGAGFSCETVGLEITDSSGGDSFVSDQEFESYNEEAKAESESINGAIEMEEVPSNECPRLLEFPDTVIASEHVDMIDTILGINQGDARQLVSNTELDQRNHRQAEINEQLPLGAENVMSHSSSVVDEIECEEATYSASPRMVLRDHLVELDNNIFSDACEDLETDSGVHDGKIMFESSLKVVSDVYDGKFTSIDGVDILPLERASTDLFCSTLPVCEPINANFFAPLTGELEKDLSDCENENLEQIESIREKYLWLLHKLGRSCGDFVAMELEEQTKICSDFSLSILVIGKTGVGKSATINSIFGEKKTETDAFGPATKYVKETVATVNGLKVKVIDTPGLRTSRSDLSINRKVLSSIKRSIKKSPPDVVLYVDRLDMQTCDFTDLPIFRLITAYLGSSIWRKSIIVLSHAASLPPDELFVDQRSSFIQKMIFRLYGDSMYPGNIVPVSLVENDSLYKASKYGEKLLFLCYSMKILLELNSVAVTSDSLSSPDLSFIRWKSDIISGCNLQCHFGVGKHSKLHVTTDLKEKLSGGISIKTRGSDQLQIAVLALLLISKALSGNVLPS